MRIVVYESYDSPGEQVERALKALFIKGYDIVIVLNSLYLVRASLCLAHNSSDPSELQINKFSAVHFASFENMAKFCATLPGNEIVPIQEVAAPCHLYLWGSREEITKKIAVFAGISSDVVAYVDKLYQVQ